MSCEFHLPSQRANRAESLHKWAIHTRWQPLLINESLTEHLWLLFQTATCVKKLSKWCSSSFYKEVMRSTRLDVRLWKHSSIQVENIKASNGKHWHEFHLQDAWNEIFQAWNWAWRNTSPISPSQGVLVPSPFDDARASSYVCWEFYTAIYPNIRHGLIKGS